MRVLASDVLRSAAVVFDIPLATLIGRQREKPISRRRTLACRAIRTLCPHVSYPAIGRMLDGRDHTTIVKNLKKIDAVLEGDPELAEAYDRLLLRATAPEVDLLNQKIAAAEARLAGLTARRAALLNASMADTGA